MDHIQYCSPSTSQEWEFNHTSFTRRMNMKKSFVNICIVLVFCWLPVLHVTTEVAQPTQASVAEPTQKAPVTRCRSSTQAAPAAGAYTLPQGALVQPVPLAAGAQFTGAMGLQAGRLRLASPTCRPSSIPTTARLSRALKAQADKLGVEMVTFSPSGDSDIAGQMKQLQDVATQGFDAVILSTHDENAAWLLVKKSAKLASP